MLQMGTQKGRKRFQTPIGSGMDAITRSRAGGSNPTAFRPSIRAFQLAEFQVLDRVRVSWIGSKLIKEAHMDVSSIKQPSAFVPVAMSLAALATVLGHVAVYGVVHEADEGAAAHIFQLLMAAQIPVVAYFAFTWLRRSPRQALQVLALQGGAALAACTAVFFLT
jgi:hypothetical protein